ncbi:hypothetical protein [Streptomyces sp. 4R-3d]|uniref:hypothetical protein n=1 Tax=Streptomyces sp. 4R-3d TaxID=2559605 RepID=UPI00107188FA|nr:hypothetical protein [Streptomyces sp. 4R-3d]TFI30143.1 hypothetical protein E4P36_05175 [Streptomyces sp. 4R-3d]
MATYDPGFYAFAINFNDPNGYEESFTLASNVTVDRPMTDADIAQVILDEAQREYPGAAVLRVPRPNYKLSLKRR